MHNYFFTSDSKEDSISLSSIKDFRDFVSSPNTTLLFKTNPWMVGCNGFVPISLLCNTETIDKIGVKIKL